MTNKYEQIEKLLERFFEGETSNQEEQELYSFFSGSDIPDHLKSYIPVLEYLETGIKEEIQPVEKKIVKENKTVRLSWKIWIGVAATLLLIVSIGIRFFPDNKPVDPYEGSYIIRNGEKITDLDKIRPELEATVSSVQEQQKKINKLLNKVYSKNEYEKTMEKIATQYCEWINTIPDETTRERMKEILNIKCN